MPWIRIPAWVSTSMTFPVASCAPQMIQTSRQDGFGFIDTMRVWERIPRPAPGSGLEDIEGRGFDCIETNFHNIYFLEQFNMGVPSLSKRILKFRSKALPLPLPLPNPGAGATNLNLSFDHIWTIFSIVASK